MKDNKTTQDKPEQKKYIFVSEMEREVAVCIAVQKIGNASIEDIINKIYMMGSKITEKQTIKCAENLRARGLLSIDFQEKDNNGVSIKRYRMKSIKLSIPENAQIKDIVDSDDESIKELKDELDRSKGTRKKGMKTFDYYKINIVFDVVGDIQGFIPDNQGILKHYRDSDNNIIFFDYHFKNWFRANLPLINRASSSIGDIFFQNGRVISNKDTKIIEKYVTNIESGFNSSKGTGGRGSRKAEVLSDNSKVLTSFTFPREFLSPKSVEKAFKIICENGKSFGGNHKLSTGKLVNPIITFDNDVLWEDE
jgi:hypothetical protein